MDGIITKTYKAPLVTPGAQEAISLDSLPFSTATLCVAITNGSATYHVEFTLDDVNNPNVTPVWFTFDEFPVGSSSNLYTAIYYPMPFVRLNIEALTGTVQFKIAQATTPRS